MSNFESPIGKSEISTKEVEIKLKNEALTYGNIKDAEHERFKDLKPNTWNESLVLLVFVDDLGDIYSVYNNEANREMLESLSGYTKDESMITSDVTFPTEESVQTESYEGEEKRSADRTDFVI